VCFRCVLSSYQIQDFSNHSKNPHSIDVPAKEFRRAGQRPPGLPDKSTHQANPGRKRPKSSVCLFTGTFSKKTQTPFDLSLKVSNFTGVFISTRNLKNLRILDVQRCMGRVILSQQIVCAGRVALRQFKIMLLSRAEELGSVATVKF